MNSSSTGSQWGVFGLPTLLKKINRQRSAYLFISPFFVDFLVFGLFPILFSVYLSLTDWSGLGSMKFVGLKNFVRLLNDERFLLSIRNMFILWLGHIFFLLILAFLVAVILDAPMIKGRSIYRTMVYLPNVTPIAVMGLVFGFIFEFNFGVLNSLLANIGFSAFPWLTDQNWIKVSIILVNLWGATGWYMVILLAGLQNIDATLYEAAEIDGAGSFQKLIFITLPSLKGLLFFCFLTETIGSFQLFTEPFILVGGSGGSQGGGLVPAMYMYQQAFEYSKMGYASALSLALFAIILVASLIQWRLMDRED